MAAKDYEWMDAAGNEACAREIEDFSL